MTLAVMAFTALAAAFVLRQAAAARQPMAMAFDTPPGQPAVHVGATEDWSPAADIAVEQPPATVAHAEADVEERTILADFDDLIASWWTEPDWLTAWRADVDAFHVEHGIDTTAHHRWRWGVVDVPTGEYPLVPTGDR